MKSILIVAASALVAFGCTHKDRRASYSDRYTPEYGTAYNPSGQRPMEEASGKVSRFITNPAGDVDGLLLEDGMQVHFPPHMSAAITKSIGVGDVVIVKGYERNDSAIWAAQMITPKNANLITISQQTKGKFAESNYDRRIKAQETTTNRMRVAGEIDTLLQTPQGALTGFILTDGSVVHLPLSAREPSSAYDIGQTVDVVGYGTENTYGRSVEASTINRPDTASMDQYDDFE